MSLWLKSENKEILAILTIRNTTDIDSSSSHICANQKLHFLFLK